MDGTIKNVKCDISATMINFWLPQDERLSVLVARSSGSLNFELKTPFHGWRGRRQTGGDGCAAPATRNYKWLCYRRGTARRACQ